MRSLMLATDFSERSDRALRRATLLAKDLALLLTIVHVVDDDQPKRLVEAERDIAFDLLFQLQTTLKSHDGVGCEVTVVLGAPADALSTFVRDVKADMLVIGSHRRQALKDVFVGTTAERTLRSSSFPVLMVNAPPVGPYREILMTTDLSDASQTAIRQFLAFEIHAKAQISILHLLNPPLYHTMMSTEERREQMEAERRRAVKVLSDFAIDIGRSELDRIIAPQQTLPGLQILDTAKSRGADLIVMATHGKTGLSKLLLGSVTEEVFRTADRDVLAMPV